MSDADVYERIRLLERRVDRIERRLGMPPIQLAAALPESAPPLAFDPRDFSPGFDAEMIIRARKWESRE